MRILDMLGCTLPLDAQCSMCRTLLAAPLGAFGVIAAAAIRSRKRFLAGQDR